ncbi:MAG: type II 3-dehydroquinate dehydratase [Paracoccaceae bacterium]|nr:type II 3-dehydroquinate dehydratase [Paracoccaceae bacterium]MDE2914447.1 type II 3-dehydroquinate dehydratase [Paracoccaceae bacterium]
MKSILVLNGPNLNLLGTREPEIYGSTTLADIEALCISHGQSVGVSVECRQSNHEGTLIDWIQNSVGAHAGIVLNPGGYAHTSIALMDAILGTDVLVIEVHVSDIYKREPFRHRSYTSKAARQVICGRGAQGYIDAINALLTLTD